MDENTAHIKPASAGARLGWLKILGIVLLATTIATTVSVWAVSRYLFPSEFKPVSLSVQEEQVLEHKLERLDSVKKPRAARRQLPETTSAEPLTALRYSEENVSREIILSEKELNALLARNTNLARKLAIDLSEDLASARLLIPLDEDFPFLGGRTLKVSAGMSLAYREGRPVVALSGVSLWGVPLPNAWLGNLKNVDLVREFGDKDGFWSSFAAGVEEIEIAEGRLRIALKE